MSRVRRRVEAIRVGTLLAVLGLILVGILVAAGLREVAGARSEAQAEAMRDSHRVAGSIDDLVQCTQVMLETLSSTRVVREQDSEAVGSILTAVLGNNPEYVDIWATRADGWNYASAVEPIEGRPIYVGDYAYFQEAVTAGQMSLQCFDDPARSPGSFIVVAHPTRGADGAVNGLVAACMEGLPMNRLRHDAGLPAESVVLVVDGSGGIIAQSGASPEWIGRNVLAGLFTDGSSRLVGFSATTFAPWKVIVGVPSSVCLLALRAGILRVSGILVPPLLAVLLLALRLAGIAAQQARITATVSKQQVFLEKLIEHSPAGIAVVTGPDHRLTMANAALRRMLGASEASLLGKPLAEVSPAVRGRLEEIDEVYRTRETRRVAGFRGVLPPRDAPTYCDIALVPLPGPDGSIEAVLAIVTDVSGEVWARKKAEELAGRLETSLAELEAVFNSISEPLFVVDRQGTTVMANTAAARIQGFERATEALRPLAYYLDRYEFSYPDGRPMPADAWPLNRLLSGEAVTDALTRIRDLSDGSIGFYSFGGSIVRDPAGQVTRLVLALKDITAQREAEAERERLLDQVSEKVAELEAVINSIADGLILFDPEGRIVRTNDVARELTGLSEKAFPRTIGGLLSSLGVTAPDGKPLREEESIAVRALRGETVTGHVTVHQHQTEHRPIWVSATGAPIRTTDGRLLGAVVTLNDITPIHLLQEERDDFVRAISHDLRSPLTAVQGHAQLLQRLVGSGAGPDRLSRSAQAIEQAGQRMASMIRDLVDSVRLESARRPLEKQPVYLASFVLDVVERVAGDDDIGRYDIGIPFDLEPVQADPVSLERVLTNLLTNAIKYSPPASLISVRAWKVGSEVTISVANEGRGIPPEDISHIFERFFRAAGSAGETEGLGLGLYIARMLVAAHGGRIWAESSPARGATFKFTLPV